MRLLSNTKTMKMKIILTTGIILASVLISTSCSILDPESRKGAEDADSSKVMPVRVQILERSSLTRTLDYTANLVAFKEIYYAPASPGRIKKIYVDVGSKIKEGQILLETDKTQLTQALTQLESASSNFNRIDTLHSLGSISEQQYDLAKSQYDLASQNVDFLQENTKLKSPINGIVTGRYYEDGEIYSGAPTTPAGKSAVVSIMQINPVKAIVNISQSFFPDVEEGMKAEVTTDIYPGRVFQGKVSKVHPTIDPYTRTFKAELIVENDSEILRPGMFARIELALIQDEALLVPSIAVLKQDGTNNRFVFVNDGGTAKQVNVTIGKRFNDMIEINAEGISEGIELVTEGQANLMNGSLIKVVSGQ
jgi:membrane fusion protein, multidrug efflux system